MKRKYNDYITPIFKWLIGVCLGLGSYAYSVEISALKKSIEGNSARLREIEQSISLRGERLTRVETLLDELRQRE